MYMIVHVCCACILFVCTYTHVHVCNVYMCVVCTYAGRFDPLNQAAAATGHSVMTSLEKSEET